ncbi:large subunit ribosomal protein L25 [Arcanobacterium wilhelmae]|uniref:Large ribosomal subunit protein bL25 n=1 Tax=Arcanobacterium wilhelmae TaxID=1803177 RepID=A0ABT9NBX3_9ACTO|nr:50S ribosomal protein L25/general stress protein Ctc [Arcanobacterium wilhelmae]MDP9801219.1 large subunit ribosomal protein L25 [Arcanobacterium wilhelmae]WFN90568.1 50S ribosomal protein L25/general stress protein Ctc [Arcanobacterium wilhelmae]
MADRLTLVGEKRTEFGKGFARRMRVAGKVPAVVYGHGVDPLHVTLDYHETYMAVRGNANALISLELEGEKHLVLLKDKQVNPLSRKIEHLDLLRVNAKEKVEVEVPVVIEGEPFGDAVATVELMQILVKAPVIDIPEQIVVSVEGLEDGTTVRIADVKFPEDVETELDPEDPVVVVAVPQVDPELEAEAEANEAGDADAEPAAEAEGDAE